MSQGNILAIIGAFVVAGAWVAFAEHPSARNLRRAVVDTLEFLN